MDIREVQIGEHRSLSLSAQGATAARTRCGALPVRQGAKRPPPGWRVGGTPARRDRGRRRERSCCFPHAACPRFTLARCGAQEVAGEPLPTLEQPTMVQCLQPDSWYNQEPGQWRGWCVYTDRVMPFRSIGNVLTDFAASQDEAAW